jgi:hypothetical protein
VYRSRYLSAHFSFIMVYLGCLSKRSKTCCANKLPYHIKQHRIKTDGEEKCRDRQSCDRDPWNFGEDPGPRIQNSTNGSGSADP